ncbi:SUMF1/EgtB/PvdO family nonheme iron enzyme [Endozoicomonas sp. SM1973]|uniref:SUMF1/EgtB/PvdO family nonheme iron enzyme n=1 Tax=Spartinivicinus marinus TaxID=2994442 RepID=A0A853I8U5_9GAMM|nr:SUMF1/EgtB/PvdO family nonheme iron enzyme [Spartinivicinus marinus]MCX4028221.1 SUMF1/EgtB/PvdO family nonheme iron enzyme [Spartinivicinus marinus]NYZ69733.1 SUMF1/EgtB/PvdO family nonheme iron enzyme [Spartinivicinus marinus]
MLKQFTLLPWLSLTVVLSAGCNAESEDITQNEDVKKLIKHTLDNMVFVKGGSFMMGDFGLVENGKRYRITAYPDDDFVHKVTLDSFYMYKYEANNWEMKIFKKYNPIGWELPKFSKAHAEDYKPAHLLLWTEAKAYCDWLGKLTKLPFDLPTEAQWEYAARSRGQEHPFATATGQFDKTGKLNEPVVKGDDFDLNNRFLVNEHYPPNQLGLYNMMGSVGEWVKDYYAADYYEYSPEHNPQGPKEGDKHAWRSGMEGNSFKNDNIGRGSQGDYEKSLLNPSGPSRRSIGVRCVINYQDKLP